MRIGMALFGAAKTILPRNCEKWCQKSLNWYLQFALPERTRAQIAALILDLDLDARDVVILAVAQLWQREIGEPDRDVYAELDELEAEIARLQLLP